MKKVKSKLFVVATPIGNLEDFSERAKRTLKEVEFVLCEDTRVTQKLLSAFDIKTPTESFHQHSTDAKRASIVQRLVEGANMAFVSDAGTPTISDPGGALVADAVHAGIDVVPIPGASALLAALSVCGFPADTFTFLGFPPHKKGRRTFFDAIAGIEHTVVLYESKHRIAKTLDHLPQDRPMLLARELTKLHETLYRGTAEEIKRKLETASAKGEFAIVLAPMNWKTR